MKHVVLFDRLAFQKHKLNPDGTQSIEPDGPEEIVHRGYDVPDYVQDWERSALANAGMIVPVADVPQPAAVPEPLGPPEPGGVRLRPALTRATAARRGRTTRRVRRSA
jgi:hypothetical protein